jgi:extracellular solute-binding protein family 5
VQDDKQGWNQFRRIKLDRKQLARRVKKAEGATQRHAHRFITRRIDNIRLVAREVAIWLSLVGLLIAGLGVQLYFGQQNYIASARGEGGTYSEGSLGQVNSINPLFASTSTEASVARLMFSSLYNYDTRGELHQDLATGMKIDDSHKVYTVTIRDDVKWHDGKTLTAEDVVFTINLIKNSATRANTSLRLTWLDASVRSIDKRTVEFTLPAPYASFPHALTFPVVPRHLLKDTAPSAIRESAYSRSPVGSGPFQFRRLQEADAVSKYRVVHLSANGQYYGGKPKLDRFEMHAYPDEKSLIRAINVGEVSGAADVSVSAVRQVKNSQTKIIPQKLASGVYIILNTQQPILQDKAVRKALQVGTDTKAVRTGLGGGVGALDSPLLPGQLFGNDIPVAPAPDIKKATAILDEAGWKMSGEYRVKGDQKLTLTITTTKDREYDVVLRLVQEQWRKLGIKVEENIVDTSNAASSFVQNTLQSRNFDVLLYELVIGADPDVFAYWHSSQATTIGRNLSNYMNQVADTNLASARSRLEPELRNTKYKQFVKQWLDDVPAIALYQPVVEYAVNGNVDSVLPHSTLVTGVDRYANVTQWTVQSENVYKTP